jgi:4-amino-4-deoxy-L-arabinose transferase-like glycosyltransferase
MQWSSLSSSLRALAFNPEQRRRALLIGLPLLLVTAFKLWLALTTYGTNDVKYWNTFMDYIVARGSVTIYRDIWYYNHPPLMSGMLWLLSHFVRHAPNGFPFLIRLPAIGADVVSVIVTYRLVRFAWDERRALVCAMGVALSPILVMVSGFHGNTDPLFMCLVLLAADRLVIGRSALVAGLLLGLAINVKLVPLIVVPVFFFYLPTLAAKMRFVLALVLVVSAGFGYHVLVAYPFMKKNVFDYAGLKGIWGITELCAAGYPAIVSLHGGAVLKKLIALLITGRAVMLAWPRRTSDSPAAACRFLHALGWAFLIFLLLTPGFGVQYLAWLAIAAFLCEPIGAIGFNLLGGAFMFSIYHYWNRGFPWNFADSDSVGTWRAPQALLGRAAWIYLVVWAALMLRAAWVERVRGMVSTEGTGGGHQPQSKSL